MIYVILGALGLAGGVVWWIWDDDRRLNRFYREHPEVHPERE